MDPSGGAGLLRDVMTLAALGVHPMAVCTADTVQNGLACESIRPPADPLPALEALAPHLAGRLGRQAGTVRPGRAHLRGPVGPGGRAGAGRAHLGPGPGPHRGGGPALGGAAARHGRGAAGRRRLGGVPQPAGGRGARRRRLRPCGPGPALPGPGRAGGVAQGRPRPGPGGGGLLDHPGLGAEPGALAAPARGAPRHRLHPGLGLAGLAPARAARAGRGGGGGALPARTLGAARCGPEASAGPASLRGRHEAPGRHAASWCAAGPTRPSPAGWGRANWTRACRSPRRPGRRCAPWRTWPGSCPAASPCSGTRPRRGSPSWPRTCGPAS